MDKTSDKKWMKLTNNGEWAKHTVHKYCICLQSIFLFCCQWLCMYRAGLFFFLPMQVSLKSGTNVLYWRTTGVTVGAKVVKPVLIKNIQIEGAVLWRKYWSHLNSLFDSNVVYILCNVNLFSTLSFSVSLSGVAYMSECLPCKPGTFSNTPGSASCKPCPRNTYSGRGASSCTPCDTDTHYACKHITTLIYTALYACKCWLLPWRWNNLLSLWCSENRVLSILLSQINRLKLHLVNSYTGCLCMQVLRA